MGITLAFKFNYRKQLKQKNAVMINGGLLQDFTYRIWDVLSAMHFTADTWRLISLTVIKKCFAHYGFPVDHVSSTVGVKLKFTEDEENY